MILAILLFAFFPYFVFACGGTVAEAGAFSFVVSVPVACVLYVVLRNIPGTAIKGIRWSLIVTLSVWVILMGVILLLGVHAALYVDPYATCVRVPYPPY